MSQYSSGQYALFLHRWHGLHAPARGAKARDFALDRLQAYVLPCSDLESRVLPARIADYHYGELDRRCKAGTLCWQGHERIGARDGAVSIFRAGQAPLLVRIRALTPGEAYVPLRNLLATREPCEFGEILSTLGGFPPRILASLWDLVWAGEVSNTRLTPLLSLMSERVRRTRHGRSRRQRLLVGRGLSDAPPGSAGRWYLVAGPRQASAPQGERDRAVLCQLLERWGIVSQRCLLAEGVSGGLGRYAKILRELEEAGRVRQGSFIDGCGITQYALPEALELLESGMPDPGAWLVAATDPVNPYGRLLPWPKPAMSKPAPQRVAGARVVLSGQGLIGYLSAAGYDLITFVTEARCRRNDATVLISALARASRPDHVMLLRTIDGQHPARSPLSGELVSAGFQASRGGYIYRV